MGMLSEEERKQENVLTRNGFVYSSANVTREMKNCYEKCVHVGIHLAYVAVSIKTGQVIVYVQYDFCGGDEVARYSLQCLTRWDDDNDVFFAELDEKVTDMLSCYKL